MHTHITWQEALALLRKHNDESFHIQHGLTLGYVLEWYARSLGYADDAAFWGIAGLLHDVDFGHFPDEHLQKAPELLAELDAEPELVRAILSHGYGMCSDVQPEHEMEKVLFAVDELTGLISAAILMRPSKSVQDLELKSLKKKFKDKSFAAGCSRDTIRQGAEILGWELDDLMQKTIAAMRSCEEQVRQELQQAL